LRAQAVLRGIDLRAPLFGLGVANELLSMEYSNRVMLLEPAHADTFAVSWTGTVVQVEPFVGEVTVIWAVAVAARIERNAAHRSVAGWWFVLHACILSGIKVAL